MEKVAVLQLRWERSRQLHVDMCVTDARKAVSDQTKATVAELIDAHQHALAALECERDYWERACTKAINYIDKMEAHEADSARVALCPGEEWYNLDCLAFFSRVSQGKTVK